VPININDDNDVVVAQYGIRSIPTLIFIKQGEQLHKISGYHTPDEMRTIINEINK
jgi:thioredoxin-like negative regulator of GroEL